MNATYYYGTSKKTQDSEQNLNETIEEETDIDNISEARLVTTFGGEHYLNEYEIITNDEVEDENDEIVDLTSKSNDTQQRIEYPLYELPKDKPYKLQLNLNTKKIALKSQTTKINKSILPETETEKALERQQSKECKNTQHVPTTFIIEPLSNDKGMQTISGGSNGIDNLPEITLTSFEMRKNAPTTHQTMKKSATVTFQTFTVAAATASTTTTPKDTIKAITEKSNHKHLPCTLPILPPPKATTQFQSRNNNSTSYKNSNTTTAIAEIHNNIRRDSEDSSEIYSLPGGGDKSTSPESLMDTILSAASSVSVCESSTNSLSSTATDATRLGVNIVAESPRVHTVKQLVDTRRHGGVIDTITTPITTTFIEGALAGHREMLVNGSLTKPKKIFSALSTSPATTPVPAIISTPPTTTAPTVVLSATRLSESQSWLQPPEYNEAASSSRSRSPSPAPSVYILPERSLYPDELKCKICSEPFNDPRTLNCLHSFCFQCLVNEHFNQDKSIPFWSQPKESNPVEATSNENGIEWKSSVKSNCSFRSLSPDTTIRSISETTSSPLKQRRSSFSFRRKKSQDRINLKNKSDGRTSQSSSTMRLSTIPINLDKKVGNECERVSFIHCKICSFPTELPVGGLRQIPQNFVLQRKLEEIKLKAGDEIISNVYCTLCFEETNATYHCVTCTLNLCTLCKEAHERQRNTACHKIKNIMELRRARRKQQTMLDEMAKFTLKCGMHPGFEIKSFCTVCLQVACADCLVLLHKGHKYETISKAIINYSKLLNNYVEQTRPLCHYADHAVERLSAVTRDINRKCDEIQAAIEAFMQQYFEALEVHQKTLLQQVNRARDSRIEILLEQQLDMEKRSSETQETIRFCQELREQASDVEVLSFLNILFKRFDYCQQFKSPTDPKFSDSLHFLPKIVAPSTKEQNDITLYGIITMQIVEPALCTLQTEDFTHLRLHKRVELTILTRDADGVPLCHGGMLQQMQAHLKYKENGGKELPFELSDNRDGTYSIAFTPDTQGTLTLTITIDDKPIKESPYTFCARSVRPHTGIYHCCSFCSSGRSKGNKSTKCSCEGRMPGYNGCGHGHAGHPGRRHWSCCGSVLENSECNVANKLLNA